jgi:hypothetical protein
MQTSFSKIALAIASSVLFLISCENTKTKVDSENANTRISTSEAKITEMAGEAIFEGELTIEELVAISVDSTTQEQLDIFAFIPDGGKLSGYKTTEGTFKYTVIEKSDSSERVTEKMIYCQGKSNYGLVKCAVNAIDKYGCIEVTKEGNDFSVSSCQPQ